MNQTYLTAATREGRKERANMNVLRVHTNGRIAHKSLKDSEARDILLELECAGGGNGPITSRCILWHTICQGVFQEAAKLIFPALVLLLRRKA